MKNPFFYLIILLFLLMCGSSSFAENKIISSPNTAIIIYAKQLQTNPPPIIVNGNTLLPLRQLVINLGVKDDPKNIKWNPLTKSIYIVKDNTSITLKVNSSTAYVNGKPVKLSAPPVIYKNSTYIPIRFISQTLNKKVVWHPSSNSVIITEYSTYNEVKKILDKCANAMDNLKKYEINYKVTTNGNNLNEISSMTISGNIKLDIEHKKAYLNLNTPLMGFRINTHEYLIDNTLYTKSNLWGKDKWKKTIVPKSQLEQISLFNPNYKKFFNDGFYSALKIDKNLSTSTETVLYGKLIFDDNLLKNLSESSLKNGLINDIDNIKISGADCKLFIDKSTSFIKRFEINLTPQQNNAKIELVFEFTNYNGDFTITLPEEAKNAEEIKN